MNFIITSIIPSGLLFLSILRVSQEAIPLPHNPEPKPVIQWSKLEFKYRSKQERRNDIDDGIFVPGTPAAIDVEVAGEDYDKTFFVSIPRFQPGSPATYGRVTKDKLGGNHLIDPYPNWNWHRNPKECNPDRLISVYRSQIDSCGRLWILDTGSYEGKLICLPQIIAFDWRTDTVLHRYEIPSNLLQSNSLLVTPVVDTSDGCMKTFIYMADCQGNFLIVYDVANNDSWSIRDKTMYPDPDFGTFTILGESFDLMDGILGMAINLRHKRLFFHAMSSNSEHYVKIEDIRNKTRFESNPESSPEIFHSYKGRRKSQAPAEVIDKDGILYFGDVNSVTLNCWDTSTEYRKLNIKTLASNHTILQFISGIKVINSGKNKQDLYFLTSRFQKVAIGNMDSKEINFRVLKLPLNNLSKRRCV